MAFNLRYVDYPSSPDREFTCDFCPLSFDRHHDLKRHVETHSGEKPYLCDRGCGKAFTRKDALKRHQTTFPFCPPVRGSARSAQPVPVANTSYGMHPPLPVPHPPPGYNGGSSSYYGSGAYPAPPPPPSNWAASQYGGRGSSATQYGSAVAPPLHSGGGSSSSSKYFPGMSPPTSPHGTLFIPPPSHGGDFPASPTRPYPCDACPLSFDRHHDFKRHRVTHVGERPYVCNGGCEKTFTRKDALKRHQLSKECGRMDQ
ncbi:hypothetical protein C8F04DRAFT_1040506 [Mycena alexandri]|uniref:C2H2-type domain-containing protein n=1 Tax=Mycena alexandri TaxID=1745969 RepID=A0AAD6X2G0_9AGAR|nr:hypothetical protein C8F04DRAFT_1040506 [Mycena alexandri]